MADILPPRPPAIGDKSNSQSAIPPALVINKPSEPKKTEAKPAEIKPLKETPSPKNSKPIEELPKTAETKDEMPPKSGGFFSKLLGKLENKKSPEYQAVEHNIDITPKEVEEVKLSPIEEKVNSVLPKKVQETPKVEQKKEIAKSEIKKHDWTSPPEQLTNLVLKHNKDAKVQPQVASKPTQAEKQFNELHEKMESAKNEMLEKSPKVKPDVVKAKVKIRNEYEKYQNELKRVHNEQMKMHEASIKEKEKKLQIEQAKLDSKLEKMKVADANLTAKQKKINEQAGIMDSYSKQINELNRGIQQNKEIIATQKAEIAELKTRISAERKRYEAYKLSIVQQDSESRLKIRARQDEFKALEREHIAKMKEMEKEARSSHDELAMIQQKSESILKNLEAKEAKINEKTQKLEALLAEEKRIASVLRSDNSGAQTIVSQTIDDSKTFSQEEVSFDNDYTTKFEVHEEPVEDEFMEKISDCKQLIEEGDLEDAKVLYNEIREDFIAMQATIAQPSEREKAKSELKELYEEICLKIIRG